MRASKLGGKERPTAHLDGKFVGIKKATTLEATLTLTQWGTFNDDYKSTSCRQIGPQLFQTLNQRRRRRRLNSKAKLKWSKRNNSNSKSVRREKVREQEVEKHKYEGSHEKLLRLVNKVRRTSLGIFAINKISRKSKDTKVKKFNSNTIYNI